jgi:hypothetical protein
MKKILFGLLALGTISAQASMLEINGPLDAKLFDAQVNDEKSYFETLGDLFQSGVRPNLTKISHIAWAGRCFIAKIPNDPINAGYIFRQKRNDAGPIAATTKAYEAFSYWLPREAPNYFDKMDIEQVFAAVPNLKANAHDARIKSDSIEIDVNAFQKSNLKESGKYLVEEISEQVSDVGPIEKQTVVIRCYYFIPELNI